MSFGTMSRRELANHAVLWIAGTLIALSIFVGERSRILSELREEGSRTAAHLATLTSASLWSLDTTQIKATLETGLNSDVVYSVSLQEAKAEGDPISFKVRSFNADRDMPLLTLEKTPILYGDSTIGAIELTLSNASFVNRIQRFSRVLWTASLLVLIAGSALVRGRERLIEAKETAELALRVKSEFIATLSHELRTPLNGILGFTELLIGSELTPRQRADLASLRSSGESLQRIISDILDFSKFEAGKFHLDLQPVSLRALMEEASAMFEYVAKEKDVTLVTAVDPKLPAWVLADSTRLRQVLVNLIGNAVKFTPKAGGIVIRLFEAERRGEKSVLEFSVSDSGIGIAPDKQTVVFEAFTQADSSTTRNFGGTGLGLSIAQRFVEAMGGRIQLYSTPDLGSRFLFTLAFDICESPLQARVEPELCVPVADPSSVKVLLVEDNRVNRRIAAAMLEKAGWEVIEAENGREALDRLDSTVTVVLMDCQMPVMDGFEAARLIRKLEEDTSGRRVPIVALTANAMEGDRERCLAAGMDDHIAKPVRGDELRSVIQRHL